MDGGVLRAWRRSRGWDVPEMARRLRRAATDGHVPSHDSLVTMVYRWERTRLTVERYLLLYGRALGVALDDLAGGPLPPAGGGGGEGAPLTGGLGAGEGPAAMVPAVRGAPERVSSGQVPKGTEDVHQVLLRLALASWARGDSWDVDDVERRELLRLLGGLGVAAPLAGGHAERVRRGLDSALNAPTTAADVAEWERVAARYSADSGKVAPALLLPELLTDLDEAQQRLKDAPESLRPPMARVCGYLSALAACSYFNGGDEGNAGRYWRTALRLIDQAGDRAAQAGLYGYRAVFALDDGSSPSAALELADEAVSVADGTPCAGAARGYVARATALALLSEHSQSLRALRDLAGTFARMPGAAAGASGMLAYSEQELHFTHSRVYSYAGRACDAVRSWEAGRALIPDGLPLATAAFDLGRATGLILDGDVSEGARQVVRTIQALPAGYRQSVVVRQKAIRALEAAPSRAANVPAVTEARELLALPSCEDA